MSVWRSGLLGQGRVGGVLFSAVLTLTTAKAVALAASYRSRLSVRRGNMVPARGFCGASTSTRTTLITTCRNFVYGIVKHGRSNNNPDVCAPLGLVLGRYKSSILTTNTGSNSGAFNVVLGRFCCSTRTRIPGRVCANLCLSMCAYGLMLSRFTSTAATIRGHYTTRTHILHTCSCFLLTGL